MSRIFYDWISIAALLLFFFARLGSAVEDDGAGGNSDWREQLYLLENILKDLKREEETEERFTLFIRAETTFSQISEALPEHERGRFKKRLQRIFRRLPPPPAIFEPRTRLRFSLREMNSKQFYWSEPISEQIFVEYLNDLPYAESDLSSLLPLGFHRISWNSTTSAFVTDSMTAPITGLSYNQAKDFVVWYTQLSTYRFNLPSRTMVAVCGEDSISCLTTSAWKEPDVAKSEAWAMFGTEFYCVFQNGEELGMLPEASTKGIRVHLIASTSVGKTIYLDTLKDRQ